MIGNERLLHLIVSGKVAKQMGNTVAGHVKAYAEHLGQVSQDIHIETSSWQERNNI